ncbi:MAG: hypothetical protein RR675_05380 [Oscillospiraceae bacterium]
MTKTLINDCFNLGAERLYSGEKCYKGVDRGQNMIELENGIWLKSCSDGRYYKDDNENSRWATVQTIEFDENGEVDQSIEFLGYTEI